MKPNTFLPASLILLAGCSGALAAEPAELKPLLAIPDKVVLQDDYATAKPLPRGYAQHQRTRWAIEDGVLRGRPSSAEYQATKTDHAGLQPRLAISACPQEFAIRFDVRFLGGESNHIFPFVECGHHVARVAWPSGGGAKLLADGERLQLAEAPEFKIEPGRWYSALAELKGEEFVIQFADGPTLYGRHPSFVGKRNDFGVTGNIGGTVELDNVTVWSVQAGTQADWAKTRAALPQPKQVATEKAAGKKEE